MVDGGATAAAGDLEIPVGVDHIRRVGVLVHQLPEIDGGTIARHHVADEALARLPYVALSAGDVRRVRNGLSLKVSQAGWNNGERIRLRDEKRNLIAVADFKAAEGLLHPKVVIARDNP